MKIELLTRVNSPARKSPSIYRTDRGTYVLQGWKVPESVYSQTEDFRDQHEELIEIPSELVDKIKQL